MPRCLVCERLTSTPWDTQPRVTWWRCPGCGLFFVDPQPDDAELSELYQSVYYDRNPDDQHSVDKAQRMWSDRLSAIEQHHPRGRVLDVGCGRGEFLQVAQERAWEIRGTEIDSEAVKTAPEPVREQVFIGPFENLPDTEQAFDVITLFDVIEHVRQPLDFLIEARRRLRSGGMVVITTPNLGTFKNRLRGNRCKYFQFERYLHLYHFTKTSLTRALQASGYGHLEWVNDRSTPLFVTAQPRDDLLG